MLYGPLGRREENNIHDNDENKPETRRSLYQRPQAAAVRGGAQGGTAPDTSSLYLFQSGRFQLSWSVPETLF